MISEIFNAEVLFREDCTAGNEEGRFSHVYTSLYLEAAIMKFIVHTLPPHSLCVHTDDLIDVVEGNRVYLKCLYVSYDHIWY